MTTFTGGCHCGQISLRFKTQLKATSFTPGACDCDFCRKHGAVYLSDSAELLEITTSDAQTYRFGLGITDFHTCPKCGVLVAATLRDSDGAIFGVVNQRVVERNLSHRIASDFG